MAILIDGYNLLNSSWVLGTGQDRGSLQAARRALLDALARNLRPQQRRRTTIVFDARDAPPGLPRTERIADMTIRYADKDSEADDLLELLIGQDSAPKRLTVVSSDHRVQRAARRRRAAAIDSDVWMAQVLGGTNQASNAPAEAEHPGKRDAEPMDPGEVAQWLEEFNIDRELE